MMLDMKSPKENSVVDQCKLPSTTPTRDEHQRHNNNNASLAEDNHNFCMIKYQIEKEVVDANDGMKCEFLHLACHTGSLDAVQYLLEELQLDVGCENDAMERNTALHTACQGGSLPLVKYLVEKAKADKSARNFEDWTPLHFACFGGNLDIVQYLVEEQQVDTRTIINNSKSPLHAAYYGRQSDVIQYMLPRSVIDEKRWELIWKAEPSWDMRKELLENYATNQLELPIDYIKSYPLHALLQCPVPSEESFSECFDHYDTSTCLKTMDENGRLPLHLALESAMNTSRNGLTAALVERLIEMEPRSATVKDATSGLYPFEVAAQVLSSSEVGCRRSGWFNVMYSLLRKHDPTKVSTDCHSLVYLRENECQDTSTMFMKTTFAIGFVSTSLSFGLLIGAGMSLVPS